MRHESDVFQNNLEKGETINWMEYPQPFRLVEEDNKKSLYLRWILTPVIAILLIVICIILAQTQNRIMYLIVFPAIMIAAAFCVCLKPMLDAHILRNNRTYIITDRRVILVKSGNFYSLPLEKINEVRFVRRKNGYEDVIFGKPALQKPYTKVRKLAISPIEKPNGPMGAIIGGAFYNISDAEKIKTLLAPGTIISGFSRN